MPAKYCTCGPDPQMCGTCSLCQAIERHESVCTCEPECQLAIIARSSQVTHEVDYQVECPPVCCPDCGCPAYLIAAWIDMEGDEDALWGSDAAWGRELTTLQCIECHRTYSVGLRPDTDDEGKITWHPAH